VMDHVSDQIIEIPDSPFIYIVHDTKSRHRIVWLYHMHNAHLTIYFCNFGSVKSISILSHCFVVLPHPLLGRFNNICFSTERAFAYHGFSTFSDFVKLAMCFNDLLSEHSCFVSVCDHILNAVLLSIFLAKIVPVYFSDIQETHLFLPTFYFFLLLHFDFLLDFFTC
jgi:hypothetical protein